MWQNVAYIAITLGFLVLFGWGAWSFFAEDEIELWVKIITGVIGGGFLLLLGIAIRDRIKKARTDKFKEVQK